MSLGDGLYRLRRGDERGSIRRGLLLGIGVFTFFAPNNVVVRKTMQEAESKDNKTALVVLFGDHVSFLLFTPLLHHRNKIK